MNKFEGDSQRGFIHKYSGHSQSCEETRLYDGNTQATIHITDNVFDEFSSQHRSRMTFDIQTPSDTDSEKCDLHCVRGRTKGRVVPLAILIGYMVYLVFAVYLNPKECAFIVVVGVFVIYVSVNSLTRDCLKGFIVNRLASLSRCLKPRHPRVLKWGRGILTVCVLIGIVVFLVLDLWDDWIKWIPLAGLTTLILISVLFSKHRRKIDWVPVIWGLFMQFALGLLILRWEPGFQACKWVGHQVTTFLSYTDAGNKFVFGDKYTDHPVVFQILPVVIFFSAVVSVLYFLGTMQIIIKSIAILLEFALGTTPIESFATAAHIFIGQVESSVALRPFWMKLTESELHAIMTSGFATVAGTVIAAYVEFGVPAEHVISASFMSAPAALAVAKLSIPETQPSKIKTQKEIKLPSGQETNLIEALSVGATTAVKLIAYVVVNLVAFLAVLAFLDSALSYFGSKVNFPQLSFQLICSYVFMPLAAVMGVPWSETKIVGALIGKKIVINEFLAYIDLGKLIEAGTISDRSVVLTTYLLCGFGSIAALGINLGSLSSAAPERRSDFARLSLRAMLNGNIACFMTACVAGLLYQTPSSTLTLSNLNGTLDNSTTVASEVFNTTISTLLTST